MRIVSSSPFHAVPSGRMVRNSESDSYVTLWSVQALPVLTQLLDQGYAVPSVEFSEYAQECLESYSWMARKVKGLPGTDKSYDPSSRAMFWAWARIKRRHLLSQVRSSAAYARKSGVAEVLFKLRIPSERAVVTDFHEWNLMMYGYPAYSSADEESFVTACDQGLWWEHPVIAAFEERTGRSFDVTCASVSEIAAMERTWDELVLAPLSKCSTLQVTFAALYADDVVEAHILS